MKRANSVICKHCGKDKIAKYPGGNILYCKPCKLAYNKAYNLQEEQRIRAKSRKARDNILKYGISPEEYAEILKAQSGQCAGCGYVPREGCRRLEIDHKHQKNDKKLQPAQRRDFVRGALCHRCNRVLGMALDKPGTLLNLAEFLVNPPAKRVIRETA